MESLQPEPIPKDPLAAAQLRVTALYEAIAARRQAEIDNGAGLTLVEIRQRLGHVPLDRPE